MKIVITGDQITSVESRTVEILQEAGHEVVDLSLNNYSVCTPEEELLAVVKDADAILAGLEHYTGWILEQCPNLKAVSRRGIGYDSVDEAACRRLGIHLFRTTGYVEDAVAEHAMAFILYFARRVDLQSECVKKGLWNQCRQVPGARSRTVGIVGFGGIGKAIAVRANAMGMRVVYNCRHPEKVGADAPQAEYLPLEELQAVSDYVVAAVPATADTREMFNDEFFGKMKAGSVFINIARGSVMDVDALKKHLDSGHLGGAATDVMPIEPCRESPLFDCENMVLTPHSASMTQENNTAMNNKAAQNLVDYFNGCLEEKFWVC